MVRHRPSPPTHRRGHLPFEAFLATILVFLLIGILSVLPWGFHGFDPIKEVLRDFSYTDVYYSKISQESAADTSIVLVNIGHADRAELAALVLAVGRASPSALGLDAYFSARADSGTQQLAAAFAAQRARLVTGQFLYERPASAAPDAKNLGTVRLVGDVLAPGRRGYLNFVGNDSVYGTVRSFQPFWTAGGKQYASWSAELLRLADPKAFADLQGRKQVIEPIRYCGNLERFVVYDAGQILEGQIPLQALRGKMVLLGFLGESRRSPASLEDLHYTPLNKKQIGHSLPDMYGCVIQANILSMMLHRNYVTTAPQWVDWLLAFGVCYLHILCFMYLHVNHPLWYHPLIVVVQFLSGAVLIYAMIELYVGANIDLSMSLPVLTVILAVDVISVYEALAAWAHRRWGINSYINHVH